jgi:leucyl/phenylalanyl-tRNA---protein transferase
MPIYLLSDDLAFPSPENADEDGLLAIGGDLSPERLVIAYSTGIFPWYSEGEPIMWWSPDPRMIIKPEEFTPSRSLRRTWKRGDFTLTMDTAFRDVITQCARVPRHDQDGTWITPEMMESYCKLHELGIAHSVECRSGGQLVGGIYGLSLGNCFFGESMFAKKSDASKLAFWALMGMAQSLKLDFVDCQLHNPHLESLGAYTVPRATYMNWLYKSLAGPTRQKSWTQDFDVFLDMDGLS